MSNFNFFVNSYRVVAEVNAERKQKPKARPKASSDAKKHLNSVRVIQRNLVYVIGLPSNMADENVSYISHLVISSGILSFALC